MRFPNKVWIVIIVILVVGVIFSIVSALYREILYISEEDAIEIAKRECMGFDDQIKADFITCKKANERFNDSCYPGNTRIWLVSVDGTFPVYPPPRPDESPNEPIKFPHCYAFIDAKTGQSMGIMKTGERK